MNLGNFEEKNKLYKQTKRWWQRNYVFFTDVHKFYAGEDLNGIFEKLSKLRKNEKKRWSFWKINN